MANKSVDGFGNKWRYVRLPGGETRRVRDHIDHEDVQLEQREILEARALLHNAFWFIATIAGVLTAIIIGALVYLAHSQFPNLNLFVFAVITSSSLLSGLLVAYNIQLRNRVYRMELHLLTVHDEVLSIKECLERS